MLVRVAAAVLQAPRTEPAATPGASESAAAIEVEEGLLAARTLELQNLLLNVLARGLLLPLPLLDRQQPPQLGLHPRPVLPLQLLHLGRLQQPQPRPHVLPHSVGGQQLHQRAVIQRAVAALAWMLRAGHPPFSPPARGEVCAHGCLRRAHQAGVAREVPLPALDPRISRHRELGAAIASFHTALARVRPRTHASEHSRAERVLSRLLRARPRRLLIARQPRHKCVQTLLPSLALRVLTRTAHRIRSSCLTY
mmetsp:Transcript_22532/g.53414  ORF Transcript_22532/g.53414 Transcript_22532/m.53414 type:complete len:252 (-) Transcript_22532:121-876(-)